MGNSKYLKMKPVKENFEINEAEGIVKCFQTWDFFVPREIAQTLIFDGKLNSKWSQILTKNDRHIYIETVGCATKDKYDVWNADKGRHIASTKASMKAYRKYLRLSKKMCKTFEKIEDTLKTTAIMSLSFLIRESVHLAKIADSNKIMNKYAKN